MNAILTLVKSIAWTLNLCRFSVTDFHDLYGEATSTEIPKRSMFWPHCKYRFTHKYWSNGNRNCTQILRQNKLRPSKFQENKGYKKSWEINWSEALNDCGRWERLHTESVGPSTPTIKSMVRAGLWNNQSGWWGTFTEIQNLLLSVEIQ